MTNKTKWTKETRPNVKSTGRPTTASERVQFKKHTTEAIENVAKVMRLSSQRVDELAREIAKTQLWIEEAEALDNQENVEKFKKRMEFLHGRLMEAGDATVKHSVKILDYSYKIVMHEDNLTITRSKMSKVNGKGKGTDEDGDDEEYSYTAPIVSLKPV